MTNKTNYLHGSQEKLGILLVNLGTPEKPTTSAVRKYLAQFLADRRVVEKPRLLWWFILHGIILRIRPKKVAQSYKKIWSSNGSPLLHITRLQTQAIQKILEKRFCNNVIVDMAMCYSKPSISSSLNALNRAGARRLLILPLYPQYSATTTAAVFDQVVDTLKTWRWLPDLRMINHYHDHPQYILALANSIRQQWKKDDAGELLLFSFHGIPQSYVDAGDPYFCHCHKTARLVAEELQLKDSQWRVVFQSRFGREPWLQPYCSETLKQLPSEGIKNIDIICPGFAADCLETMEEIFLENKAIFYEHGGNSFNYIHCLNASDEHNHALSEILTAHLFGWPETMPNWDAGQLAVQAKKTRDRALKLGAKK